MQPARDEIQEFIIEIIEIDPKSLTQDKALEIAQGIEAVRRLDWKKTYANEAAGITADDIEQNFRSFEESVDAMKNILLDTDKNKHVWIAKDKGRIIGFCTPHQDEEGARLGALYIHPDYQGKGVGSKLMKAPLAWYGKGVTVALEVVTYNENALGFYQHFGFEIVGRSEYKLKRLDPPKSLPTIRMERKAA